MSSMGYSYNRRYSPHSVPLLNYDYTDANDCLSLSHTGRLNPPGYHIGGPVGGPRIRSTFGHDEHLVEHGPSRRRIAVACGRCRKRKIRCSGDVGDGMGCTNCKSAGLAPSQCLFHRVGSDHVQKVMDGITVAQNLTQLANSGQPFLLHGTTPCYTRPTSSHMDHSPTKSIYSSGWTTPYSEETSPVENYFPNHHGSYTQNSGPVLGSNAYAMHDEWTYPTKQSNNLAAIPYYDQVVPYIHNGLPMSSSSTSSSHDSEPYSSMNMTSLQMSLPERPPPQQHSTDRSYQRHLLPIPQPSSHQSSRNVVDQLQHQRLRSAHGVGTSSMSANPIYSKPLIPWVGDNNSHVNPSCKEPAESALSSCTTSDDASTFPASTCSTDGLNNAATTMPLNLNFSSSALLDTITAPSPHITYSNFRQKRTPCQPAQESTYENNSGFSMYTFETNKASRRKAKGDASPTSTLVSGHRYSPPALDISPTPYANSKSKQEFYTDHKVPVQRSSLSKLTSKF